MILRGGSVLADYLVMTPLKGPAARVGAFVPQR